MSHVWAPSVVPAFEFGAQKRQMVKSLDKRHASQPLVFESLDDSLGYGDGAVLAYGSEPRFVTYGHMSDLLVCHHDGIVRHRNRISILAVMGEGTECKNG